MLEVWFSIEEYQEELCPLAINNHILLSQCSNPSLSTEYGNVPTRLIMSPVTYSGLCQTYTHKE